MNLRKVISKPPRALVLSGRREDDLPVGRISVDPTILRGRNHTIAGEVAAKRVPLDDHTAPAIAKALETEYRRVRRMTGGRNG